LGVRTRPLRPRQSAYHDSSARATYIEKGSFWFLFTIRHRILQVTRKSRGKVEEIAKKSSGNHVEKQRKSPREVQEIAWASVNTFIKPFNFFQGSTRRAVDTLCKYLFGYHVGICHLLIVNQADAKSIFQLR